VAPVRCHHRLPHLTPTAQVDNQPTRFKYAPVDATAFDLTPEEILLATDAELNTYVGLSKLATYRAPRAGGPPTTTKRSRRARELRGLLKRRAWGEETARDEIDRAAEVVQRRAVGRAAATATAGTGANAVDSGAAPPPPKKRKGKKERDKLKKTGEVVAAV
jgi:protein KRI1